MFTSTTNHRFCWSRSRTVFKIQDFFASKLLTSMSKQFGYNFRIFESGLLLPPTQAFFLSGTFDTDSTHRAEKVA